MPYLQSYRLSNNVTSSLMVCLAAECKSKGDMSNGLTGREETADMDSVWSRGTRIASQARKAPFFPDLNEGFQITLAVDDTSASLPKPVGPPGRWARPPTSQHHTRPRISALQTMSHCVASRRLRMRIGALLAE